MAVGSSEKTVASSIAPCFRRTHLPSFRSMAGMISMMARAGSLLFLQRRRTLKVGVGSASFAVREENEGFRLGRILGFHHTTAPAHAIKQAYRGPFHPGSGSRRAATR